jgi:superfamily I DNA and/or RNA helicase
MCGIVVKQQSALHCFGSEQQHQLHAIRLFSPACHAAQIVVVEEAGEVFEAHVLASLSRATEHLILVGDHEQLRPKPNRYELQAISGRRLDLDVSLFERLARTPTFPRATLAIQRRMRPDISR